MRTKRIIAVLLICIFTGAVFSAGAGAQDTVNKDETVYVNLSANGNSESVYVVNAFDSSGAMSFVDYGQYSKVSNLTDGSEIISADGANTIKLNGKRFYYQGELYSKSIPWKISIGYKLDDKEIPAGELAGKSGKFELTLKVSNGAPYFEPFYKNYILQISTLLNGEKFTNVKSDDASFAVVGKNINVSFTHLMDSENTYTLSANVTDFELGQIQFNGVKMGSMGIDTEKIDEMIDENLAKTDDIDKLIKGGNSLRSGAGKIKTGLDALSGNFSAIASGAADVKTGIDGIAGGLATLSGNVQGGAALANALLQSGDPQVRALAEAYLGVAGGLDNIKNGADALKNNYGAFLGGVNQFNDGISQTASGFGGLNGGIRSYVKGVNEMAEELKKLPDQIRETTDEFIGGEEIAVPSFTSDKNTAESVTFVLKTNAIKISESDNVPEKVREPETFWEKMLDLFGLFKGDEEKN